MKRIFSFLMIFIVFLLIPMLCYARSTNVGQYVTQYSSPTFTSVTVKNSWTAPNYVVTASTYMTVQNLTVTNSTSTAAKIDDAILNHVKITDLQVVTGATNVTITNSTTTVATETNAIINHAKITDLQSCRGQIDAATVTESTTTRGTVTNSHVTGSIAWAYSNQTDSATLTAVSPTVQLCSKTTPMTITLPAVATKPGLMFCVKKTGTGTEKVTIITNSSETIDGVNDPAILDAQWDYVWFISNGTAWFTVADHLH